MLSERLMMEMLPWVFLKSILNSSSVRARLGGQNHPLVLTGGFNRLKTPQSICQKVVNTGQYESEWSIDNFKGPF